LPAIQRKLVTPTTRQPERSHTTTHTFEARHNPAARPANWLKSCWRRAASMRGRPRLPLSNGSDAQLADEVLLDQPAHLIRAVTVREDHELGQGGFEGHVAR
jgi:hypothetical protein